ncbi:hypothetical protein BDF19DRAFT_99473 [Syncephalis fuscata]|nr:hypothetical protein BDF19DRAFT_99473 [Syncephalis fuscata]
MATTSAISEVEAVSRGHSGDGPQLRGHPRRGSAASEASSEASLASSASSSAFLLAPSSQEVTDSAASGSSTSFVPSWVLSTLLLRIYTSSVFHRIYKWFKAVYGVFSGTSELQRICTPRPTLQFICITSTGKLAKDPLVTDVDPLNGHDSDTSNNGEDEVPPSLPLMRTGSNGHQHHRRVFLPAARTSHSTDSSKVPLLNSRSVPIAVIEISVGTVYRVDRAILYSSKLTVSYKKLLYLHFYLI